MSRLAAWWGARRGALAAGVLLALFAALPLATSVIEVCCALGLLVAVLDRDARAAVAASPLWPPALLFGVVCSVGAAAGGPLREGIGHAWLLAPIAAVPALRACGPQDARVREVACWAASAAAVAAIGQRVGGVAASGPLSHHLSLAYALLPPLAFAVGARRWAFASLIGAGILATGSAGAAVALAGLLACMHPRVRAGPWQAFVAGSLATLVGLVVASDRAELLQRAVLWTGGLGVAVTGAAGPGGYAAASAPLYDALQPGFWFPNHAHDAFIQLLATLGWPGLAAMGVLATTTLRSTARHAGTALAFVLVGAWTQDVLGDLEVARAAWAWAALGLYAEDDPA